MPGSWDQITGNTKTGGNAVLTNFLPNGNFSISGIEFAQLLSFQFRSAQEKALTLNAWILLSPLCI